MNKYLLALSLLLAAAGAAAAKVVAPGTLNTGMKLLLANPLLTFATTLMSAGSLFAIARKYGMFAK